jgi:L-2-hydroxyglutarate oxidase
VHVTEGDGGVVVATEGGEVEARAVVNCAGLHSDTLASTGPADTAPLRIVPFRGEYHRLAGERTDLVRTMIYPVPDPRFPFLGAHFTRGTGGEVHAGPNAVLALAREGYSWRIVDPAEVWDLLRFPGFRHLAARHWRTGAGEVWRSFSKGAFVRGLQRLVPDVRAGDLTPMAAGVRAQAVDAGGNLVEDFVVRESARMVHVLNAPSPAATASLEIGRMVAALALEKL